MVFEIKKTIPRTNVDCKQKDHTTIYIPNCGQSQSHMASDDVRTFVQRRAIYFTTLVIRHIIVRHDP